VALRSNEAEAVSTLRKEGFFMSASEVPADMVEAYKRTQYLVQSEDGTIALRVGHQSKEMADLIQSAQAIGGAFITAENPFSRALSANENKARQDRLREDLIGLGAAVIAGAGQGEDPAWPAEASWAAIGISRDQARELGIKYQQNAIVWIDASGTAELILLR
jgi:hypothetical protein